MTNDSLVVSFYLLLRKHISAIRDVTSTATQNCLGTFNSLVIFQLRYSSVKLNPFTII